MTFADTRKNIQHILRDAGLYDGSLDGIWGPKTQDALDRMRVAKDTFGADAEQVRPASAPAEASGTLTRNNWPLEAHAASFFGYPPNLTQIEPPYPMRMFYDGRWHAISSITCNVKVAASLRRILAAILAHYGSLTAIQEVGLDVYDGCYNDRNVRGSTSKRSMHAYGAAIDFDAEHNPLGAMHGRMPAEVVAMFKAEGWRWGGDYSGRKDWMHFEACV